MVHSMVVKHWPMMKVKSMLEATLMPAPAARVSRGWISLQRQRYLHSALTAETSRTEAASIDTIDTSLPRWQACCGSALTRQLAEDHVEGACQSVHQVQQESHTGCGDADDQGNK